MSVQSGLRSAPSAARAARIADGVIEFLTFVRQHDLLALEHIRQAGWFRLKQSSDGLQRQAKKLENDDLLQLHEVTPPIQPVSRIAAMTGLQQPQPVVMMQCPHAYARQFRELMCPVEFRGVPIHVRLGL